MVFVSTLSISLTSFCQTDTTPLGIIKYPAQVLNAQNNYLQFFLDSGNAVRLSSYKTRTIKKITHKSREALLIVQQYQSVRGTDTDSAIVDAATLLPLEYHSNIASQKYREHAYFRSDSIDVSIVYADSVVKRKYLNSGVAYLATTDREIISQLPLQVNYESKIHLVNAGLRQAEVDLYVKVLGEETYAIGKAIIPVYSVGVSYQAKPKNGKYPINCLITRDEQKLIIKQQSARFIETMVL